MTRLRCAILDDYLKLAFSLADWSKVEDRVDVTVFDQPFATPEAAAGALKDFEIICAMRERTPFPRTLFAALPKLKLLITSGSLHSPTRNRDGRSGLFAEIRAFWHQFFTKAFDPYRPELHYMRGPGPACRAKHAAASRRRTS